MAQQRLPVEALLPTSALRNYLIAADGTTLFSKGEQLSDNAITMLRASDIESVFSVSTVEESRQVRQRFNTVTVDIDNAQPEHVLAKTAKTSDGRVIFARGCHLTESVCRTLRRHGMDRVDAHIGKTVRPETTRFLADRRRLRQSREQHEAKGRGGSMLVEQGRFDHRIVQTILDSWIRECHRLAGVLLDVNALSLEARGPANGEQALLTPLTCLQSATRGCWVMAVLPPSGLSKLARCALNVTPDRLTPEIINKFTDTLWRLSLAEAVRTAPRCGTRIRVGSSIALGGAAAATSIPHTEALTFSLR